MVGYKEVDGVEGLVAKPSWWCFGGDSVRNLFSCLYPSFIYIYIYYKKFYKTFRAP